MSEGLPMLDRRQLLRLIGATAVVGATGAAAACSTALPAANVEVPTGRTIRIGLVSPALGPLAKIGDDIQKGFKLFLADNDGMLGLNNVELKSEEEGSSKESAQAAVQKLLEKEQVIAIAGMASGDGLSAAAPAMVQRQIPLVTCGVAPSSLSAITFLWRTANVEGEAGRALAPFARHDGGDKAFVLYEESSYARQDAAEFKRVYREQGGTIVGERGGRQAFSSPLQEAKNAGADVIFAAHSGADALSLLEAFQAANMGNIKLVGPGSLTETVDLSQLRQLPNNVYTGMYYAADLNNEANRRFVSSYFKAHGTQPSGYATAAYDSASVLNKALRLVKGEPTGAELNKALAVLGQIESPRGVWTFNTNRGPQQRWYLRRLRLDGKVPGNLLDTDLEVLS